MTVCLENRVKTAVDRIFDLEHRSFGAALGMTSAGQFTIDEKLLKEIVYAIDELSWSEIQRDKNVLIQLIALTWEHAESEQKSWLLPLAKTALARAGVSPSQAMLENNVSESDNGAQGISFISELASTVMRLENAVSIAGTTHYLSEFQHKVVQAASSSRIIGISAPTSAGKSFAIYLSILNSIKNGARSVIYIVPTISLMNQVCKDLQKALDEHGINDWFVLNRYTDRPANCIFVLTQERATPREIFLNISELSLLVVDEIQNIERIDDEGEIRSKVLMDVISEIHDSASNTQIILSGPRVSNISEMSESIFSSRALEISSHQPLVASITYAISRNKSSATLKQYSEVSREGRTLAVSPEIDIQGIGKKQYSQEFLSYLSSIILSLGPSSNNIIFSPTSDQARRTARGLIPKDSNRSSRTLKRDELASYVSESIHPEYDLVECVRNGVAFHTGKVPPHIRLVTELAFSDGIIKNLACTTTLMQGVNLPANVVIARNPNLFIKARRDGSSPSLSDYEFSNLRGRAGRLMKDFVGRTIVLDETSFAPDGQGELFPDATKEIVPTYQNMFQSKIDEVMEDFRRPGSSSGGAKFICAHVRQAVVRHGDLAQSKLLRSGINISSEDLKRVSSKLGELTVPREICLDNRYWDPHDLQMIKDNLEASSITSVPESPWKLDPQLLSHLIEFQANVSPYYFNRYMDGLSVDRIWSIANSALEWSRERPLSDLIKQRNFDGSEVSNRIDRQVSDIQKFVIHGVPSLLKPVVDILGSGHGALAAIESGVFSGYGRLLVGQGLYRETAIYIKRRVAQDTEGEPEEISTHVLNEIHRSAGSLDYWVNRQLDLVINQWSRSVTHGKAN